MPRSEMNRETERAVKEREAELLHSIYCISYDTNTVPLNSQSSLNATQYGYNIFFFLIFLHSQSKITVSSSSHLFYYYFQWLFSCLRRKTFAKNCELDSVKQRNEIPVFFFVDKIERREIEPNRKESERNRQIDKEKRIFACVLLQVRLGYKKEESRSISEKIENLLLPIHMLEN